MTCTNYSLPQATFGELLRRWRRKQGLSQVDLGQLLKPRARRSTISSWENDTRVPSRKYLSQIVDLTGIPSDIAVALLYLGETRPGAS